MTLWQLLAFLIVAGGAAYTYVVQPMSLELGIPRAQCWWQGGVYLRSTAKEPGYSKLMSQMPENQVRLKNGEAVGCFNAGQCVQTPNEALGALEGQILNWTAVGGGQLLTGNVLEILGLRAEAGARAKQAEAQYCIDYLAKERKALLAK
jgi:hypothetical protein